MVKKKKKKSTILVSDVDNEGGYACVGAEEISITSSHFCYEEKKFLSNTENSKYFFFDPSPTVVGAPPLAVTGVKTHPVGTETGVCWLGEKAELKADPLPGSHRVAVLQGVVRTHKPRPPCKGL